ncbi:ectonucleoside triphosphate diphosphohydrolase 5-like isoform X1 [Clavelina lepadiformis]|uniref:ectonucleoside triphosphate diphosphohydrolase 5-like isoform X1 n=1 Tax=Clavelina lepadiformis TaxID=159417 RepID=UPI004042D4C3
MNLTNIDSVLELMILVNGNFVALGYVLNLFCSYQVSEVFLSTHHGSLLFMAGNVFGDHMRKDMLSKSSNGKDKVFKKDLLQQSWVQQTYLYLKWRTGIVLFCTIVILLSAFKLYNLCARHNAEVFITPTSTAQHATSETSYAIMLDAGSTGSRIHVYKFFWEDRSGTPILKEELFEQVKPGLSSYANEPTEGAASIERLLQIAQDRIPSEVWGNTPLALKATAGLRLLPKEQSKGLLNEVQNLFNEYPFQLPSNPVSIMDGVDEGAFGWTSVNYLLDHFYGSNQFSVGTIDLGGGSMQITFAPHLRDTIDNSLPENINTVSIFGNQMVLYTRSYLGLGLMSAREAVLHQSGTSYPVTTACTPPGYTFEWTNGDNTYTIEGMEDANGERYEWCYQSTQKIILDKISSPPEIKHYPFYVFSYFFDRAVEMNMVDEEEGGILTVAQYIDAAHLACSDDSFNNEKPFMCMDMCLIVTFLRNGFGFDTDTQLITKSKIANKETSWALGASFSLL